MLRPSSMRELTPGHPSAPWLTGSRRDRLERHGKQMEAASRRRTNWNASRSRLSNCKALPATIRRPASQLNELHGRVRRAAPADVGQLTAWERTELARHPKRPYPLDYIERIFPDFSEIHGDRGFADDAAMVCGMARFRGREVLVLGTQKGRDTKQRVYRNFGQPNPEGYRKALRAYAVRREVAAGRSSRLIDVAGRLSRAGRGRARTGRSHRPQPARDGAAGGAVHRRHHRRRRQRRRAGHRRRRPRADDGEQHLLGDLARRLRLHHVARLDARKTSPPHALRITAKDNLEMGFCDEVIPEPPGGAHNDYDAARRVAGRCAAEAPERTGEDAVPADLLDARYKKFRNMAQFLRESSSKRAPGSFRFTAIRATSRRAGSHPASYMRRLAVLAWVPSHASTALACYNERANSLLPTHRLLWGNCKGY